MCLPGKILRRGHGEIDGSVHTDHGADPDPANGYCSICWTRQSIPNGGGGGGIQTKKKLVKCDERSPS